jgi:hypothetical protein
MIITAWAITKELDVSLFTEIKLKSILVLHLLFVVPVLHNALLLLLLTPLLPRHIVQNYRRRQRADQERKDAPERARHIKRLFNTLRVQLPTGTHLYKCNLVLLPEMLWSLRRSRVSAGTGFVHGRKLIQ